MEYYNHLTKVRGYCAVMRLSRYADLRFISMGGVVAMDAPLEHSSICQIVFLMTKPQDQIETIPLEDFWESPHANTAHINAH